MFNIRHIALLLMLSLTCSMWGQSKFVERSTDVLCLAPSATGLVKAVVENDKKGMLQLGLSTATGLALNYGLNACIKKDRPEMPENPSWSDRHAFPSTHAMAAFDGATFLMRRYGWKWGVPAYVVSTYVAWGRVHSDRHDWWDVLGGAAVGAGSALIFTRPFVKDVDLTIAPVTFGNQGTGVYVSVKF
ncbi:MAG: phosphatase PAP2 family protein [Muribaculaceae bacterium]|nr:phosphatase PAP2 family protein [Muribaculaceae bacterium]